MADGISDADLAALREDSVAILHARLLADSLRLAATRFPEIITPAVEQLMLSVTDYRAAKEEAKAAREEIRMVKAEWRALFDALHRDLDVINDRLDKAGRVARQLLQQRES